MIFTPNNGSEVSISGRIAQWIAQAKDAVMPIASQLNPVFMHRRYAFITCATKLQLKFRS